MGFITDVESKVSDDCLTKQCGRDRCNIRLDELPFNRIIIDMDCKALGLTNTTRCDYLLVSEDQKKTCVVPIELKGGGIGSATRVANQLRGGADLAAKLLPQGNTFQFVPVLAHKKSIHRAELKRLRNERIILRGIVQKIKTMKCGAKLIGAICP